MRFSVTHLAPTALCALTLLALPGCEAEEAGIPHPVDVLDYPVSVTADPAGDVIWVSSGNFDLAWQGGALMAMDVDTHGFAAANSDGEAMAVQVGGMPGPIQLLERDGQVSAIYVASRTDDALYHIVVEGSGDERKLSCVGGERAPGAILRCPTDGAITTYALPDESLESGQVDLGVDPYALRIFRTPALPDTDLLAVGSMGTRAGVSHLSLFSLDADGVPQPLDRIAVSPGLVSIIAHPITGRLYTSHKEANTFQVFDVRPPSGEEAGPSLELRHLVSVPFQTFSSSAINSHGREMAFSSDGRHLYAAYRAPSSIAVMQVDEDDGSLSLSNKISLAGSPGDLHLVPADGVWPERLYVSAFSGDRIDVVDPMAATVVDSISTGRGPYGLTHLERADGLKRLYVSLFYENAVGVVELETLSPYHHDLVAQIP